MTAHGANFLLGVALAHRKPLHDNKLVPNNKENKGIYSLKALQNKEKKRPNSRV